VGVGDSGRGRARAGRRERLGASERVRQRETWRKEERVNKIKHAPERLIGSPTIYLFLSQLCLSLAYTHTPFTPLAHTHTPFTSQPPHVLTFQKWTERGGRGGAEEKGGGGSRDEDGEVT
jgi:hypothetical protein